MSEINVNIIKNELATHGPNLVGHSTVTGDLHVTGSLNADIDLNVSGVTTFSDNVSVGDSITLFANTGVVTAAKFHGDGSELVNLPSSAGLGTALSEDTTSPLNKIYYTDTVLSIGSTITVDSPDSSNAAYTQYPQIVLQNGADLIIGSGDDFIPDILGIGTTGGGGGPLTGDGGRVRADNFVNRAGTGAPNASHGLTVTGVLTATSFDGDVIGGTIVGTSASISGITTTSNLVVENSAYTAITTTSINKIIVNREFCTVVTSSASTTLGIAISLPASPQPGWLCGVGIGGTFLDTNIDRNGSNIMNLSEDFTIDVKHINVSFLYVDNTYGWKVI